MTAPDHTPFLLPTDLRTPLDAADWLDKRTPRPHRIEDAVRYAVDDLRAQIDRERRQACRRGALDYWRRGSRHQRKFPGSQCEVCAKDRARALAFRAAARQP